MITLKSPREIDMMCESAEILKKVFVGVREALNIGMTTQDLDRIADDLILRNKARSAFKGYRGYPASICVSINETVVHGIPSNRKIRDGDIVSVDMGVVFKGYYSDAARTWPVGHVDEEKLELVRVARGCFEAGVKQFKAGHRLGDISSAVQQYAESRGFSVVRDFVGHGIGRALHEDPQVPNFGESGRGGLLQEGLVLAIEPMVNAGTHEVEVEDDHWTVVTRDGECSAHFENTVALTKNGAQNLTAGCED
ncbi:MAG: type I methionyl aminopeptidase [Candidatus Omnitrophica bacterium]|nr:type I methionyl aminopeptidase [Candidatus Omnitrophota bacterium]